MAYHLLTRYGLRLRICSINSLCLVMKTQMTDINCIDVCNVLNI